MGASCHQTCAGQAGAVLGGGGVAARHRLPADRPTGNGLAAPPDVVRRRGVIERLRAHYGFGRTPFVRDLAPGMLHPHRGHAEAVPRITWLVGEHAIGVVTGEVGAGKTVTARAAVATLDPVRHTIVCIPNPCIGQRGLYAEIVRHLGGHPHFHKAALVAQAAELLAAEHAEKAKTSVLIIDEAHLLNAEQLEHPGRDVRADQRHDAPERPWTGIGSASCSSKG